MAQIYSVFYKIPAFYKQFTDDNKRYKFTDDKYITTTHISQFTYHDDKYLTIDTNI